MEQWPCGIYYRTTDASKWPRDESFSDLENVTGGRLHSSTERSESEIDKVIRVRQRRMRSIDYSTIVNTVVMHRTLGEA